MSIFLLFSLFLWVENGIEKRVYILTDFQSRIDHESHELIGCATHNQRTTIGDTIQQRIFVWYIEESRSHHLGTPSITTHLEPHLPLKPSHLASRTAPYRLTEQLSNLGYRSVTILRPMKTRKRYLSALGYTPTDRPTPPSQP